ncbi:MAG: sigma-54 dependent transcriptional regulator [bacterium]|nr:sigma-54 dependent transcriptional regulator [bacterium]
MRNFKIYIVEDDPWYGELLKYHLSLNEDYEVLLFGTANELIENLHKKPDLITVDFNLPDMTGEELLLKVRSVNRNVPVLIISGQDDISVALSLLKKGASEYLMKDANTKDLLWHSVQRVFKTISLQEEVEELKVQLESKFDFEKTIIGKSTALKKSFALIEKAINSNINVSITGETGTGKEIVAKAIHYNSLRSKKPFIAVNMAAIPKELFESELFGYEKGAFTGAITNKKGKFEEANGGTIFLDEIAEADLNFQTKLLRVLQEREITRVGSNQTIKLDVRIIVATHKDLAEEVKSGRFREDLFFRLLGLPIELPPLNQRGNDILILAKHFADAYAIENKKKTIHIHPEAKEKLLKYNYPGNVRELKAIIDLACVMTDDSEIKVDDITFLSNSFKEQNLYTSIEKTLKDYNADIIGFYLKKYHFNVVEVAQKLDIGKSTIYNLINSGEIKKEG